MRRVDFLDQKNAHLHIGRLRLFTQLLEVSLRDEFDFTDRALESWSRMVAVLEHVVSQFQRRILAILTNRTHSVCVKFHAASRWSANHWLMASSSWSKRRRKFVCGAASSGMS